MADDEKAVWTKFGFQQSVQNLIDHGPSAPVWIGGVDSSSRPPIQALAQIDTGAAGSAISPRLARRLAVAPVGSGIVQEAGREPITSDFFLVRVTIQKIDIELDVAGLPSLAPPHDVLIGRDILHRFRLLVDFTSGVTQLHLKNDP